MRGLLDQETGEFFPFPLRNEDLELRDDSLHAVDITLERDEADAWAKGGEEALALTFKFQFFISGHSRGVIALLRRYGMRKGIDVTSLPELDPIDTTDERIQKAADAIRDAVEGVALNWGNLIECDEPIGLRVPSKVPVKGVPYEHTWPHEFPDGLAPVHLAVAHPSLRAAAQQGLEGRALEAFREYCRLWDQWSRVDQELGRSSFNDGDRR